MKVLYVNKYFWKKGGSEVVMFQERQAALDAGLEVVDFSVIDPRNQPSPYADWFVKADDYSDPDPDSAAASRGKWGLLKTAVRFVHNSEVTQRIAELVDKERPQVAHLHNIYHQLTPSIIPVLKKHGVKVVLTLHDCKLVCPMYQMLWQGEVCNACHGKAFWHAAARSCPDGSRSKGLLLAAEAYWHRLVGSYSQVDLFISPSRFLAELVSTYRVERSKVAVVPNGAELDRFETHGEDQGYALFMGRITEEKGVRTLARAHQILSRGNGGPLALKVAGDGPLKDELSAAYPDVEFLGYRSGRDLYSLVEKAAMVVVPSEWNENCPMTVLEAGAAARPVIGSELGGIPELIEDGVTGLIFPAKNVEALAERLAELAADPQRRREMGQAARRRIESAYDLRIHNRRVQEIYQALSQGQTDGLGGNW